MKTKWIPMTVAGLLLGCMTASSTEQSDKLWFPTDEPELGKILPPERVRYRLLPWEEYEKHAEDFRKRKSMVPVDETPADSRPLQGCGINFSFGGLNRGFCIFGTAEEGLVIHADTDADGSLQDEEEIHLERSNEVHTAEFRTTVMEKVDGKELQYPVMLRFVVLSPDQSSESFYRYMIQPWTYRSGTLRVDGHIVPFELRGSTGIYNKPSNAIWLDLDGDGQGGADYKYKQSKEYFTVRDEHVNIGDTSYKFEVDKFGRTLTLTPVDKPLPERPSLEPGTEAPGLQAPGMDGKQQSLGRYEGRVILLDFWYTTCPPCIKEAPRLAELHKQHGDGDLQILGISPDNEAAVREFTDRYDHDWPQVLEPYEGPIHRDYRVLAYPAKFLIDRDGDILCSGTAKFWERCESKLVDVLNR